MDETEHITVASTSAGIGGSETIGKRVSLPVVELLTGRGFITGKSGSGKSNSASVIAEKLLDNGFGLLIVDIDGEYYGLKEEYEILHAGGDEECDIQVTTEHAEKLASLALEQNVPIILDVSSYLDETEAAELLTAVAKSLFAKAKKQKQPFLLLVEEVHEYIPENGSVTECGKMLIKIGKRGRKHGLGICGISQRPADVKKDYITQCDWLLWHRLTWNNDTKVVRRILDGEYASAVENLDDGEGFLMTDWSEDVRRVQFHRKQTFDAGATPGLDDFERPDLKSVSNDLVSELKSISEEEQAREDRIEELREQMDQKNSRIAELEAELQDARDLSRMADQFVTALLENVEGQAPGRTEKERMQSGGEMYVNGASDNGSGEFVSDTEWGESAESPDDTVSEDVSVVADGTSDDAGSAFAAVMDTDMSASNESTNGGDSGTTASKSSDSSDSPSQSDTGMSFGDAFGEAFGDDEINSSEEPATTDGGKDSSESSAESSEQSPNTGDFSADAIISSLNAAPDGPVSSIGRDSSTEEAEPEFEGDAEILESSSDSSQTEATWQGEHTSGLGESTVSSADEADLPPKTPHVVKKLKSDIEQVLPKTERMLSFYVENSPGSPLNAHFAAGGNGDRTRAYSHNRVLRTMGLIEHVGRGKYRYRLREYLDEELPQDDPGVIEYYAQEIEDWLVDI